MYSRRDFLRLGALIGAGIVAPLKLDLSRAFAAAALPLDPRTMIKYVDQLPIPGVMPSVAADYYEVGMYQVTQKLHRDLPATTVWGYGTSAATAGYPAATFEVARGTPIQVKWTNNLTGISHPLPVDPTLHWANPNGYNPPAPPIPAGFTYTLNTIPTVAHVHGGEQEAPSDGHPDEWFTPGFAQKGPGWVHEVFNYTNEQPAATLWYHDHALGITRLNVYMGLAGFYIVRDPAFEAGLNLPGPAPQLGDAPGTKYYEIPIVIQDRMFDINGQFLYPILPTNPSIHPFWGPEFFGNTILVNGKVWPYLDVEPRKYRFRFLNGSDARFYSLKLLEAVTGAPGPAFHQIGTDGGYVAAPVMLNDPANPAALRLIIAPGERADIVIDFSAYTPGTTFILDNDAKGPFPKGAPADPQTTAQIMQFRVVPLTAPDTSSLPATLNTSIPTLTPTVTRQLTLNEVMGAGGPLAMFLDGKMWDAPVSENPKAGTTEVWEIVNLTADTHPIHLHLVQFQLLNRQKFQFNKYMKAYSTANPVIPVPDGGTYTPVPVAPYLQNPVIAPDPNEVGWKDTVRMNPGEVTRILVRFAPIGVSGVSTYPFDATAEPGYVWHCHILEHEDNEMMRPYKVQP